jgi:hypothetical protein
MQTHATGLSVDKLAATQAAQTQEALPQSETLPGNFRGRTVSPTPSADIVNPHFYVQKVSPQGVWSYATHRLGTNPMEFACKMLQEKVPPTVVEGFQFAKAMLTQVESRVEGNDFDVTNWVKKYAKSDRFITSLELQVLLQDSLKRLSDFTHELNPYSSIVLSTLSSQPNFIADLVKAFSLFVDHEDQIDGKTMQCITFKNIQAVDAIVRTSIDLVKGKKTVDLSQPLPNESITLNTAIATQILQKEKQIPGLTKEMLAKGFDALEFPYKTSFLFVYSVLDFLHKKVEDKTLAELVKRHIKEGQNSLSETDLKSFYNDIAEKEMGTIPPDKAVFELWQTATLLFSADEWQAIDGKACPFVSSDSLIRYITIQTQTIAKILPSFTAKEEGNGSGSNSSHCSSPADSAASGSV